MANSVQQSQTPQSKTRFVVPAAIAVLALVALICYFAFDYWISLKVVRLPKHWFSNGLVKGLTQLGKGWLLVWLLLTWVWAKRQTRAAIIVLLALAMTGAVSGSIKLLTQRPRPMNNAVITGEPQNQNVPLHKWSWSFPSGDAAGAFAFATVLAHFAPRRWTAILFALSICIGVARVGTMNHYPSDVFAGAALGTGTGWLALRLSGRMTRRLARRFPRLYSVSPDLLRRTAMAGVVVVPVVLGVSNGLDCLARSACMYVVIVALFCLLEVIDFRLKRTRA
jgi:undecaprenyl-diphosphatase